MIKMRSIEFNTWMSLMKLISDNTKSNQYNIKIEDIKPSYPRNLTVFKKPSIIIQKVGNTQSPIGFGRFLGQYYDELDNSYMDINCTKHTMTFQIDIVGDSNTQCEILTSLITEDILNILDNIIIYDYTNDVNYPTEMGIATIDNNFDILNIGENKDYVNAVRFDVIALQTIIPVQEFVDLTKWMKITQKLLNN